MFDGSFSHFLEMNFLLTSLLKSPEKKTFPFFSVHLRVVWSVLIFRRSFLNDRFEVSFLSLL